MKFQIADNLLEGHLSQSREIVDRLPQHPGVGIDIGAHIGTVSLLAAEKGASFILAVEADFGNFTDLVANIRSNGYEKIVMPLFGAVTDKSFEFVPLVSLGNTGQKGILFDEQDRSVDIVGTYGLRDILRYVLNIHGWIDFLKVDIEGGEYAIFTDDIDFDRLIRQVYYIDVEIHNLAFSLFKNPEPTGPERLVRRLESYGFNRIDVSDPWRFCGSRNAGVAELA